MTKTVGEVRFVRKIADHELLFERKGVHFSLTYDDLLGLNLLAAREWKCATDEPTVPPCPGCGGTFNGVVVVHTDSCPGYEAVKRLVENRT